jgi:hypothetical protein
VPTVDPLLSKLRAEVSAKLSRNARALERVRLQVGDLSIAGVLAEVAPGSLFLKSDVLVEAGERALLTVGRRAFTVRVSFSRTTSGDEDGGMVIALDPADAGHELRVLDALLELIDSAT